MRTLTWSASHAVWVDSIDDEHKEIFEALSKFRQACCSGCPTEFPAALEPLVKAIGSHFAHEERLMRAARFSGYDWHKRQHAAARRQVRRFAPRIEVGDRDAGHAMADYLAEWLNNHTQVADRMMGAHLRNERRAVAKLTFRAGTRPAEACAWVDTAGKRFDPKPEINSL
jgi:hemerythrin